MTADPRFFPGAAAERPLFTVADLNRLKDELRSLEAERDGHVRAIEGLNPRIDKLKTKLDFITENFLGSATLESASPEKPKRGKPFSKLDPFVRKAAVLAGQQYPNGFDPAVILQNLDADQDVQVMGGYRRNYVYKTLKRFRAEGVLDKVGQKYILGRAAGGTPPANPVAGPPIEGFKLVPLSKAERIHEETRRYLRTRGRPTHRAQIAEHLVAVGIMGSEKQPIEQLASYLAKWPEFQADGDGNYALVLPAEGA